MSRAERAAYLFALALVFGGIAVIGAGAGVRMSMGVATQTLECSTGTLDSGVNCLPLLKVLGSRTSTFLTGGVVVLFSGLVGIYSIQRRSEPEGAK